MERELRSPDGPSELEGTRSASQSLTDELDKSRTVTPDGEEHEVIDGIDPMAMSDRDTMAKGQEMQERSGLPLISSRGGDEDASVTSIDNMDLDHVIEDDNTAEESAAVKNVGLA